MVQKKKRKYKWLILTSDPPPPRNEKYSFLFNGEKYTRPLIFCCLLTAFTQHNLQIKTDVDATRHTKTEVQKSVAGFSEETRRLCTERSDNVCNLIDDHIKVLGENMDSNVEAAQVI